MNNLKMKIIPMLAMGMILNFAFYAQAQELGLNFNHNPEIIDFDYVEKAQVKWIRSTPRILDYVNGKLDVNDDEGLRKMVEAGERGYQVAFGFRWDFNNHTMAIPEPDSPEEKKLFDMERKILEKVGPYVRIFKLGNEPNLETRKKDMMPNKDGIIPLVRFMERQLELVVLPFYESKPELARPDIYIGSFPRLFMKETQQNPAVVNLIRLTEEDPRITGLAVHLHITSFQEVEESFEFVRKIMPEKPIIVPEFSLHRLFLTKRTELLGATPEGKAFAKKYNRKENMKLYEWCGIANTIGVSQEEWKEMFYSRDWFPENYLKNYFENYQKYGVVLATFPLLQQSCPSNMTPSSPMWFINPIFCQKSLLRHANGGYAENPLVYPDFISWATGKW
jgi:hypothetical protein